MHGVTDAPTLHGGWRGLKKEVEVVVFPTLFSYDIFQKLKDGKLMTQADAFFKKKSSMATFAAEN